LIFASDCVLQEGKPILSFCDDLLLQLRRHGRNSSIRRIHDEESVSTLFV